ncbi:TetR/AcrR family transcriptional regulator [Kosakonia pseudosacchari]|uniref:TetR/AcrR family transcriptional regulator n=1 Tax=Kosakonia pseudosacchari TaxID=1646340 RepID=UPI001882444B|nr:TetR/AcrR family transcriptional regulator [Kosakonia pseudosacchari]QOV65639.1 TetR/AcrR family transcriptional regulator [Kosakonia pseudosacchari]
MMKKNTMATPSAEKILNSAVNVLLTQGYDAASMDDIAASAGVSRRTLFNQFSTKEVLFEKAIEYFWSRLPVVQLSTTQEAMADPQTGLMQIGLAIADFWAADTSIKLARMIVRESERFPSLAKNYLELGKVPALGSLIRYLAQQNAAGHLKMEDTDLAARQFVGMINEPLVWFRVLGLKDEANITQRERVVQEAVRTFLSRYA